MYTRRFRSPQPRRQISRRVEPVSWSKKAIRVSRVDPVPVARSGTFGIGSLADKPVTWKELPHHRSSAFDITESRLGLGSNASRRRRWCDDGRIRAVRDLLISSPSTPPILTIEFVIADLLMLSRFEGKDAD